jgi:hypothetical protein
MESSSCIPRTHLSKPLQNRPKPRSDRWNAAFTGRECGAHRSTPTSERLKPDFERSKLESERSQLAFERSKLTLERSKLAFERSTLQLEPWKSSFKRSKLNLHRSQAGFERPNWSYKRIDSGRDCWQARPRCQRISAASPRETVPRGMPRGASLRGCCLTLSLIGGCGRWVA